MGTNDVIFICHGNINRSRAAEEILKQLRPDLMIDSFAVGLKAKPGVIISKRMREILRERGYQYDIEKRSQVLTEKDFHAVEHVYIMDFHNMRHFIARFGSEHLHHLNYLGAKIGKVIKDPGFSKGTEQYYVAFRMIQECCKILAKEL